MLSEPIPCYQDNRTLLQQHGSPELDNITPEQHLLLNELLDCLHATMKLEELLEVMTKRRGWCSTLAVFLWWMAQRMSSSLARCWLAALLLMGLRGVVVAALM